MCWYAGIFEKLMHFWNQHTFVSDKLLGSPSKRFYCNVRNFENNKNILSENQFNFPFNLKMVRGFAKDQRNWGLNFQHVWFDSRQTRWAVVHPTMDARAKMARADLSTSQHCSTPVNTNQHWSTLGNRFLYKTCLIDICEHRAASLP